MSGFRLPSPPLPGRGHGYAVAGAPRIYPDGTAHDWSLEYSPTAAGGRGRITVTLGQRSVRLDLAEGHRAGGARLDRFGILMTWVDGNSQPIYLDDLTYTCK